MSAPGVAPTATTKGSYHASRSGLDDVGWRGDTCVASDSFTTRFTIHAELISMRTMAPAMPMDCHVRLMPEISSDGSKLIAMIAGIKA
jgi:hypothetical protein